MELTNIHYDLINLSVFLLILVISVRHKTLPIFHAICLSLSILILIFIQKILQLDLSIIFPDQGTYLSCANEIRGLKKVDCLGGLSIGIRNFGIYPFSMVLSILPIIYKGTISSILTSKYILYLFMMISSDVKNFDKKSVVLLTLIPSSLILFSVTLKECLAAMLFIIGASQISNHSKLLYPTIILFLLIIIKIQVAIFFFIFILATIMVQKLSINNCLLIFASALMALAIFEKPLLDTLNNTRYSFYGETLKSGGQDEHNDFGNSIESMKYKLDQRESDIRLAHCYFKGLSRKECLENLNLAYLEIDIIRIADALFDKRIYTRLIMYPVRENDNSVIKKLLFIEKILLMLVIGYYAYINFIKSIPILILSITTHSIFPAIVFNESNLWRYLILYLIISSVLCINTVRHNPKEI